MNNTMKNLKEEIEKMEKLIEQLGWLFETIGGYFDMGNTEEARKHFEVAYRLQGNYIKNKVDKTSSLEKRLEDKHEKVTTETKC